MGIKSPNKRHNCSTSAILVYEIEVKTADKEKAGSVHNGWLIIKGKKGETKMNMKNSARDKILRRYTDLMICGKSHQLQQLVRMKVILI